MRDRPTVAVTRAELDAASLAAALDAVGLAPLVTPLLRIVGRSAAWVADQIIASAPHDWLVCTSRHAVEALVAAAPAGSAAREVLLRVRVAAVGARTAALLEAAGWLVDAVPDDPSAVQLANRLLAVDGPPPRRVLFPRADQAREELPTILRDAGWTVHDVPCYDTQAAPEGAAALSARLAAGDVHAVTFASGSAARAFARHVPRALWEASRLVSIGSTTTHAARDAGLVVAAEAATPSLDALAEAARRLLLALPAHA